MKKYLLLLSLFSIALCADENTDLICDEICDEHLSQEGQELLEQIETKKTLTLTASEPSNRSVILELQKALELFLHNTVLSDVMIVYHSQMPPIPLYTDMALLDDDLNDNKGMQDPLLLRSFNLDQLLMGEIKVIAVYPKSGHEERTLEQKEACKERARVFQESLKLFPMPDTVFPKELNGASYLFTRDDEVYLFSIHAPLPESEEEWAVWYGPVTDPKIATRYNTLKKSLIIFD